MPICLHNSMTTLALQQQLQQALSGPQSGKYLQSGHLFKKKKNLVHSWSRRKKSSLGISNDLCHSTLPDSDFRITNKYKIQIISYDVGIILKMLINTSTHVAKY